MIRRLARWCVALSVTGMLAACGGIPSDTPVSAHAAVNNVPTAPGPNVEFYGPRDGAPPREIVMQFLRANGATDADYAVAREYLAPGQRNAWHAGGTVAVNSGERDWSVTQTGDDTISVTVHEIARLDQAGHLTRLPEPVNLSGVFRVGKVGGEWRITALPKGFGTWVVADDFARAFVPQSVYYADRSTKVLIPDRQWFRTDGLTAALAKAVISAPPKWMQGMPLNAVPSGTGLQVDSVPVDPSTGAAAVDLTSAALDADTPTRTALWAAMLATLEQVPGVARVSLTADGSHLSVSGGPASPNTAQDLGYALAAPSAMPLIERTSTGLHWVANDDDLQRGNRRADTPRVVLPTIGNDWHNIAADGSGGQFAAVSSDGLTLARWVNGVRTTSPTFGTHLTRPSFTAQHELWIAGRTLRGAAPAGPPSALWMIDTSLLPTDAQAQSVAVPWLESGTIVAARVARDADRIALVVQELDHSTHLFLAGIIRDRNGNPTSLTQPQDLSAGMTDITSVSWADQDDLLVLARLSDGVRQPVLAPLDGSPLQELTPVAGADDVIGTGAGPEDLHVLTDGRPSAFDRVAATWEAAPGVIDYVVPGA